MSKSWSTRLLLLLILLAFALRVYNLTYHSLWFDEAVSVRWANASVARILDVSLNLVEDRLPPLYYLGLKGWITVAGQSEFGLRFPSVVLGVLLVPLVYRLGQFFFGHAVGLLAAAFTTVNPFLVWYSQEARMYALAVLLATGGVFCFTRALANDDRGRVSLWPWLGLGVGALGGLYTHLYTGFLWPALALWLVFNPQRLRRLWLAFGVTMGLVSLAFVPLALATWRFSGESTPGDPFSGLAARINHLWQSFLIWQAPLPSAQIQLITATLGLALLLGGLLALRRRTTWLPALLLLMPFLIASALLTRSSLAFFGERYFIVMLPWVMLLQAAAIPAVTTLLGRSFRSWAWGLSLFLLALNAWALPGQWSVPAAKEAWRQSLTYLKHHVQPNDAIFIHPEWVRFPYQYYERELQVPGRTYAFFFSVDAQTDLDGPLNGILNDHPVIWLVQSHLDQPDPERRVEQWFAVRFPLVTELYPPGVTIKAYAPGYQRRDLPPESTSLSYDFAAGLRLRGYDVPRTRFPTQDALFHPPSTWVPITLYWQLHPDTAPSTGLRPYVHLVDELGQVWGASLVRGNDALAFYPPERWGAEQVIVHHLDVNLNPAVPPGDYRLVVGVGEEQIDLQSITLHE